MVSELGVSSYSDMSLRSYDYTIILWLNFLVVWYPYSVLVLCCYTCYIVTFLDDGLFVFTEDSKRVSGRTSDPLAPQERPRSLQS